MRIPNDIVLCDGGVECHPWSPDDHGGGFPCLEIRATIYDEKQLDKAIKALERRRKWLAWQNRRLRGER